MKLSKSKKTLLFIVLLLFFSYCTKKKESSKEIVRVNDAVLTEDELKIALLEKSNNAKLREQYINEWIEREVLYQKAVEEGITKEKEYNFIIEKSKKELAGALLIKKILSENYNEPTEEELLSFYESLKEDFRLLDELYNVNVIYFNNYEDALRFRSTLIESDWNRALNVFKNLTSIIETKTGEFYYSYQLQPANLAKVVSFMNPGEVSVIIETEPNHFAIVQLIKKINRGEIPPFGIIKDKVKERFMVIKNKEVIQNFIKELISDYDVEIKGY
ncbi:MAG: peptidylprolyl isomerase [Melioribacter sp.]|nr:peptidylprolyl isomerase [Melioribacter sp.]